MKEWTDRTERRIRNAQAELIEEVGVQKVMDLTNMSKSVVYRWGDEHDKAVMSHRQMLTIEAQARRPLMSQEFIFFHGGEITLGDRDSMPAASAGTLSLHTAELVEHVSRLVVETARAKADGVLTIAEATRLLDLLVSAERLIPAIKDVLIGVQVGGPLKVVTGGGQQS